MSRSGWWVALVLLAVGVIGLDLATGPYVQFPILFVLPVGLAAWYLGRVAGIGFAVALVGCRLAIVLALEGELMPLWAAAVNAAIRLFVLGGLAALAETVARQKRELETRVQVLEGFLPICAFCKKIRLPDGTWEQIESYVTKRSTARFSHGFCESCSRQHYAEVFGDGARKPG